MAESKPYKSIEEQIEILKERNLDISDHIVASSILSHISYYRFSGYSLTLREHDRFYKGVKIEQIKQIYDFDSEFRSLLLQVISYIEISFRTQIANYHAAKYGALGYINGAGFISESYYSEFIKKVNEVTDLQKHPSEVYVKHHHEKYNGNFPLWVVAELLPFSWISKVYSNLDEEIKSNISDTHYQCGYKYVQNWLRGLSELRNICAHCGRLYNRLFTYKPRLSSKDTKLLDADKQKYHIFSYLYVCKKLITDQVIWGSFIDKLRSLCERNTFVSLIYYGFPKDWYEILHN